MNSSLRKRELFGLLFFGNICYVLFALPLNVIRRQCCVLVAPFGDSLNIVKKKL